jgi:hypothetical protein
VGLQFREVDDEWQTEHESVLHTRDGSLQLSTRLRAKGRPREYQHSLHRSGQSPASCRRSPTDILSGNCEMVADRHDRECSDNTGDVLPPSTPPKKVTRSTIERTGTGGKDGTMMMRYDIYDILTNFYDTLLSRIHSTQSIALSSEFGLQPETLFCN